MSILLLISGKCLIRAINTPLVSEEKFRNKFGSVPARTSMTS